MRIDVVTPTVQSDSFQEMVSILEAGKYGDDVSVNHQFLDDGPPCVENHTLAAQAVPGLLRKGQIAQEQGAHAFVINCVSDPGLDVLRENLNIPVIGTGMTSMHLASMLAHGFGILDISEEDYGFVSQQVQKYGMQDKFRSYQSLNVSVLEIEGATEKILDQMVEKSVLAITRDRVGALIFGCGAFSRYTPKLDEALRELNLHVPIVDPLPHTVQLAVSLSRSGLAHSERTYPPVS